jgi:hypothetical protein
MFRFDVSEIIALGLLCTIAERSGVAVEALAHRVVATSGSARLLSG